jgi:hypothetical protein
VPTAVKMAEESADALNTVFVEVQGHTMDDVRKLGLSRKWFGTNAIWTTERPCGSGRGIPFFVLLSPEGEVVMSGNPLSEHKAIEDYVHEQQRARMDAPEDLPKKLKKAWKEWVKGDFADALKETSKLVDSDDAEIAEAAKKLETQIRERARAEVKRFELAVEEGFLYETLELLEDRVDDLGDEQAIEAGKALLARLESEEMEEALKADKAWTHLRAKLFEDGMNDRMAAQLQHFAEKFANTPAAAQAEMFARAAGE